MVVKSRPLYPQKMLEQKRHPKKIVLRRKRQNAGNVRPTEDSARSQNDQDFTRTQFH